jgi:hypothetical protein
MKIDRRIRRQSSIRASDNAFDRCEIERRRQHELRNHDAFSGSDREGPFPEWTVGLGDENARETWTLKGPGYMKPDDVARGWEVGSRRRRRHP